jgi:hypothetical protein
MHEHKGDFKEWESNRTLTGCPPIDAGTKFAPIPRTDSPGVNAYIQAALKLSKFTVTVPLALNVTCAFS